MQKGGQAKQQQKQKQPKQQVKLSTGVNNKSVAVTKLLHGSMAFAGVARSQSWPCLAERCAVASIALARRMMTSSSNLLTLSLSSLLRLTVATAVNLLDLATAAKLAAKQQQPKQPQLQQAQPRSKQGQQQLDEAVAAAPALKALRDAGLNPVVPRCMAKLGFTEPTPIQSACWGHACAGKDVLGHAEPGT